MQRTHTIAYLGNTYLATTEDEEVVSLYELRAGSQVPVNPGTGEVFGEVAAIALGLAEKAEEAPSPTVALADSAKAINKALGARLSSVSHQDERPAGVVSKLHQALATAQALEDQLTAAAALEAGWPETPEPGVVRLDREVSLEEVGAAAAAVGLAFVRADVADPVGEPSVPVVPAVVLPGVLGEPWELAKGGRSVNVGRLGKVRMESADPVVLAAIVAIPQTLAALVGLRRAVEALPEADYALTSPTHPLGVADGAAFQALKAAGLEALASDGPADPNENDPAYLRHCADQLDEQADEPPHADAENGPHPDDIPDFTPAELRQQASALRARAAELEMDDPRR